MSCLELRARTYLAYGTAKVLQLLLGQILVVCDARDFGSKGRVQLCDGDVLEFRHGVVRLTGVYVNQWEFDFFRGKVYAHRIMVV